MKFKNGQRLTITNEDLLNDGIEYEGAIGTIGAVMDFDELDDTYQIEIESGFGHFVIYDLVWVHEDNLEEELTKFVIGEEVEIIDSKYDIRATGQVVKIDKEDNTYKIKLYGMFYEFEPNDLYWAEEKELTSLEPHFTPVVDEHRKHPDVELIYPKMGSKDAIACDFYSPVDMVIKPMESGMIWLDFKAIFPRELALIMNVRSNMGKQPIMLANTQGWVESDYANNKDNDGNLGIRLFNLGKEDYVIKQGDRIAQGMFVEVHRAKGTETNNKRVGGHGSTGK